MKNGAKILVVENEVIVAQDIRRKLERRRYTVTELAVTGEGALESVERAEPDLVLMDIRLSGVMTGIEAADGIRKRHGIPVLFLTAYSDERILSEALATSPYGYLLKPFSEEELHTGIQSALHLHRMDTMLRKALLTAEQERAKFEAIVSSIGEGLVLFSRDRRILYQNSVDRECFGERTGRFCHEDCDLGKETCDDDCALSRALEDGKIHREEEQVETEDGFVHFDVTASPLKTTAGEIIGGIRLLRDVTERVRYIEQREKLFEELYDSVSRVKLLSGLVPMCTSCKKIRNDDGYWGRVEEYVSAYPDARIDQSLCPDCTESLFPEQGAMGSTKRPSLTPREKEVLRWIGQGKNNWEISRILGISERTVKYHVGRVMEKLNVASRTQAVVLAMALGLLERK